ncbi:hypothetical protein BYT27DRAFT_7214752 [Phlegmacium glaucopus]|nr:hypothetical protein BYT27DRAFT_7214752 [Phlegmacium glaucopus]
MASTLQKMYLTQSTAKCNHLTPKAFEALQLLKSAYRNGHLAVDKEAHNHLLSLIGLTESDDDVLAGPEWKGKGSVQVPYLLEPEPNLLNLNIWSGDVPAVGSDRK